VWDICLLPNLNNVQTYHRLLSAFWHFYNQCLFNSFREVIWLECESKVSLINVTTPVPCCFLHSCICAGVLFCVVPEHLCICAGVLFCVVPVPFCICAGVLFCVVPVHVCICAGVLLCVVPLYTSVLAQVCFFMSYLYTSVFAQVCCFVFYLYPSVFAQVCFFVSYLYMDAIISKWHDMGVLQEIMNHKLVFIETQVRE